MVVTTDDGVALAVDIDEPTQPASGARPTGRSGTGEPATHTIRRLGGDLRDVLDAVVPHGPVWCWSGTRWGRWR